MVPDELAVRHPGGPPSFLTPLRRPGSIRRTTTHDSFWPDGFDGSLKVIAAGRDLLTAADGTAHVVDEAVLDVLVRHGDGAILAMVSQPAAVEMESFVGGHILAGFRRLVEQVLPGEPDSRRLRFQLLDELPPAVMASGRALRAAGISIPMGDGELPVDICAGWAAGGTLLAGFSAFGPPIKTGPEAPKLARAEDDLAWHHTAPLPPHSTRRCQRLDVWELGGRVWVDCFFRDSHTDGDGRETVVHEWSVTSEVNPRTRSFVSVAAGIGPLPYIECPGAAASAGRLVGLPIEGVRRTVKKSFTGPSTCTHLNNTLRSLEDVGALLDQLLGSRRLG